MQLKSIFSIVGLSVIMVSLSACGSQKKSFFNKYGNNNVGSNYRTAPHSIGGIDTTQYTRGTHGYTNQTNNNYNGNTSYSGAPLKPGLQDVLPPQYNNNVNVNRSYANNNVQPGYNTQTGNNIPNGSYNNNSSANCQKPQISGSVPRSNSVQYYNSYIRLANTYLRCINQVARSQSSYYTNTYRQEEQEIMNAVNALRGHLIK